VRQKKAISRECEDKLMQKIVNRRASRRRNISLRNLSIE